ncbi:MAG: GGGtGRT protein [Patescibacteria group bacterium]
MVRFEGMERRLPTIRAKLDELGFADLESVREYIMAKGINAEETVRSVQPIAFENAVWAYTLGTAVALKQGKKRAADAARAIGLGLQAFCVPGSVADQRQVGIGHGNLAGMLLEEETRVFAFVAGHESFAAAEGASGITKYADKVRREPLQVILVGLGKDAAQIIARVTGFTHVETDYDFAAGELKIIGTKVYGKDPNRQKVKVYGAASVDEGVAIMRKEQVDVSITGNSTNPTRFTHPTVGTYKKWCFEHGRRFFSVASGGGTGRTLHPDNMAAGPASYGFTDTLGRMHGDAQFAGSSSVPAHVDMMGFIGMGNNPIVGATVALACKVEAALG